MSFLPNPEDQIKDEDLYELSGDEDDRLRQEFINSHAQKKYRKLFKNNYEIFKSTLEKKFLGKRTTNINRV